MSRDNVLMLDNPTLTLLANFWHCVRNDLHMRGCTSDSLPAKYRRLPYQERVIIEREMLKRDAELFLETEDFQRWANLSGFNPDELKESLINDSR